VLSGLLVAVQFDVALGRFTRVMRRMQMMPMRSMSMMRRQFVFASTMMLGRFAMVLRGMFMVFSGFRVMFFKFLRHCFLLSFDVKTRCPAFRFSSCGAGNL
jgi:hypothetical protein